MIRFGLIGQKLGHSFSQSYFTEKFKNEGISGSYDLVELENLKGFRDLCSDYDGLNVTIPYKSLVLPLLDETDPSAKEIGAVNTLKMVKGKVKGYNTDIIGFEVSLLQFIDPSEVRMALILGTGGAAKAVAYVLKKLQIDHYFISRKPEGLNSIAYADVGPHLVHNCQLIINATPVGMHPNTDQAPSFPMGFLNGQWVYDLIYNPQRTQFLKEASRRNCKTKNGLDMLKIQAEESYKIWTQ